MREFGGYIEIEHYKGNEYHTECLALNNGRNCLRYLIRTRRIRKIMLPYLQCRVIEEVCRREGVQIQWYEVKSFEKPYQGKYPEEDVFYILSITMDSLRRIMWKNCLLGIKESL